MIDFSSPSSARPLARDERWPPSVATVKPGTLSMQDEAPSTHELRSKR